MKATINSFLFLILTLSVNGQTLVKGTVRDVQGNGIGGASVQIAGTEIAIAADSTGRFSLRDFTSGVILISHVGYESKKIHVSSGEMIEVILNDIGHTIEEVEVNTGYQRIPKERATGSFVQIDSTLLQTRISDNILDKLEYAAPGLQYDNRTGSPNINIRGINTFSSALTGPLIIVDNFPYSGNIENINPNDVESVNILKDAAATSIWGARAGNGVIVINLKKSSKSKGKLSFTANTTIAEKPDLFYVPIMNSSDFIDVERMLYEEGFYNGTLNSALSKRYVFSPVVRLLKKAEMGEISLTGAEREIDAFRTRDYRSDLLNNVYRPSIKQQYHLAFDMKSGPADYRIGVGFDNNRGDLDGQNRKRLSLTLHNNFAVGEKLTLENMISFTPTVYKAHMGYPTYPINPAGGKNMLYPYASLQGENGQPLAIPYHYDFEYIDNLPDNGLLDWKYRPLEDYGHNTHTNRNNHLAINTGATYKLMDFMDIKLQYGFEQQLTAIENIYGAESFYARNMVNRFTQADDDGLKNIVPPGAVISPSASRLQSHRGRVQVNIDKRITPFLKTVLFVGSEINATSTNSNTSTVYGYNENIFTSALVDFAGTYPIYDGLAAGNHRIPNAFGFLERHQRYVSLFGNGSVDFLDRYMLTLSARRDASNNFGILTNNRWNPLWSIGGSWILSNESFLQNVKWMNFLKLRATLGHSGNMGGIATTLPVIYYSSRSGYGLSQLPRAAVSTLPNPNLRWEDVKMVNYGVDFRLFSNRITGSVEYYTKYATDLLAADELDPTTGFTSTRRNVGEMSGKGLDIQLNGNYALGAVKFSTAILWSYNTDRVEKFTGVISRASTYAASNGTSLSPIEGRALYPILSYRLAGLDPENGDPLGYFQGEESKDYANMVNDSLQYLNYHGRGLPVRHGAIRQSVSWKSFRLSANVVFKAGHYFRRSTIMYNNLFRSWNTHADFEDRWQQPGDELHTSVPSMVYPANTNRDNFYAFSEANVERGDLIRLNDIQLSYSTPPLRNLANASIDLYINVNNVGILWRENTAGRDPDYLNLPAPRTFTFGCKLKF